MRRMVLGLAMAGVLGVGMLLGSALTPNARGETATKVVAHPADYAGAPIAPPPNGLQNYSSNIPYPIYSTMRWQIYPFYNANPIAGQSGYLVILLDGQTGDSFLLRPDLTQTSASWVRIDRR